MASGWVNGAFNYLRRGTTTDRTVESTGFRLRWEFLLNSTERQLLESFVDWQGKDRGDDGAWVNTQTISREMTHKQVNATREHALAVLGYKWDGMSERHQTYLREGNDGFYALITLIEQGFGAHFKDAQRRATYESALMLMSEMLPQTNGFAAFRKVVERLLVVKPDDAAESLAEFSEAFNTLIRTEADALEMATDYERSATEAEKKAGEFKEKAAKADQLEKDLAKLRGIFDSYKKRSREAMDQFKTASQDTQAAFKAEIERLGTQLRLKLNEAEENSKELVGLKIKVDELTAAVEAQIAERETVTPTPTLAQQYELLVQFMAERIPALEEQAKEFKTRLDDLTAEGCGLDGQMIAQIRTVHQSTENEKNLWLTLREYAEAKNLDGIKDSQTKLELLSQKINSEEKELRDMGTRKTEITAKNKDIEARRTELLQLLKRAENLTSMLFCVQKLLPEPLTPENIGDWWDVFARGDFVNGDTSPEPLPGEEVPESAPEEDAPSAPESEQAGLETPSGDAPPNDEMDRDALIKEFRGISILIFYHEGTFSQRSPKTVGYHKELLEAGLDAEQVLLAARNEPLLTFEVIRDLFRQTVKEGESRNPGRAARALQDGLAGHMLLYASENIFLWENSNRLRKLLDTRKPSLQARDLVHQPQD